MCTEKVPNPEKLLGSVYRRVGYTIRDNKSGDVYNISARNVTFENWNSGGDFVLGEWAHGAEPYTSSEGFNMKVTNLPCDHLFLLIIHNHEHWGVFVPSGTPARCVKLGLANTGRFGENPYIDESGGNPLGVVFKYP